MRVNAVAARGALLPARGVLEREGGAGPGVPFWSRASVFRVAYWTGVRNGRLPTSAVVDIPSMADLDDEHEVRWLDDIDHPVVADPQPTRPREAVAQRLAELDGMRSEFPLDRRSNLPLRRRGETRDVVTNDALQVLDPVLQSQALS
jgi:hypothetical protein